MTTDISSTPADSTAGANTENVSSNVDIPAAAPSTEVSANPVGQVDAASVTPATPAYTPNFKYKVAREEKELDPLFHGLVKDPDSEKKIKDIFTKVDAFDFIKSKKEQVEQQYNSLASDFEVMNNTVAKFDESVQRGDLSSAFRLANITKEQVFKWAHQQMQLMDMPPEQRAQYEQFEQANAQKYELEEKISHVQKQYEQQATQARVMQLDMALNRPEVSKFAEAWDRNGEPGSFKQFVIEEAKKTYYDTKVDLSPEQAVAMVMQRFGKFLNVGDSTAQSPQAVSQNGLQQNQKPVIPNITGKASSPIKKVHKSLDELKKIAKEMRD